MSVGMNTNTTINDTAALAPIVAAFAHDPVARWMYPTDTQYFTHFPTFVRLFAGKAFATGSADVGAAGHAAALWLPPGCEPDDEPLGTFLSETIALDRQLELFSVIDQMSSFHPFTPHWYLPLIGVKPEWQGAGYGSRLLAQGLARCDADRLPAYLESSNPRNIPLYERHGFRVIGTIQAGNSPVLVPMLRPRQ